MFDVLPRDPCRTLVRPKSQTAIVHMQLYNWAKLRYRNSDESKNNLTWTVITQPTVSLVQYDAISSSFKRPTSTYDMIYPKATKLTVADGDYPSHCIARVPWINHRWLSPGTLYKLYATSVPTRRQAGVTFAAVRVFTPTRVVLCLPLPLPQLLTDPRKLKQDAALNRPFWIVQDSRPTPNVREHKNYMKKGNWYTACNLHKDC
jgi:hypothetical protein